MRRRRLRVPITFLTSFLDLCCCALGGMVLLMVLQSPTPRIEPVEAVERTVRLRLRLPVAAPLEKPLDEIRVPEGVTSTRQLLTVQRAFATLGLREGHPPEAGRVPLHEYAGRGPQQLETSIGPVTLEVHRRPRLFCVGHDPGGPHAVGINDAAAEHRLSVLDTTWTLTLRDDAPDWPLLLSLAVDVETPPQRVPAVLGPLLRDLGSHWQALGTATAAAREAEVPGHELLASVAVEPQEQPAEARRTFPRLGLMAQPPALRLDLPGPPQRPAAQEARLGEALRSIGRSLGIEPRLGGGQAVFLAPGGGPLLLAPQITPGPYRLFVTARLALTEDTDGAKIPNIDGFDFAPVCTCGDPGCRFVAARPGGQP